LGRGRWWHARNRTGRCDGDGRRGERSAASELRRRENGVRRAGSGAWKRNKGGGLVRRDVAESIVGSGTGSDTGAEEAGSGRRATAGDRNGAADQWTRVAD
jgi:hypothetical protein